MTVAIHRRAVGDTLTPLKRQLVQLGSDGVYAAVDLTDKLTKMCTSAWRTRTAMM